MKRLLFTLLVSTSAFIVPVSKAATFNVITYNVENLFDWTHDLGKQDYTYLPLSFKRKSPEVQRYCSNQPSQYQDECFKLDWSENAVKSKIKQIGKVLRESFVSGFDVAVLQEVENINVLNMLAQEIGEHYQAYLIEGPDDRGIDVGVITRLPVIKTELKEFSIPSGRKTRGVLRVDVISEGKRITVLGNHWPSQGNPDEDRMAAAEALASLASDSSFESDLVVAAGDFNTADDDLQNGITEVLLPLFYDSESEARTLGIDLWAGTYNYRGVWGSLDHIFVLKKAPVSISSWRNVSIIHQGLLETRVFNGTPELHPKRFKVATGEGYSDHLPLKTILEF